MSGKTFQGQVDRMSWVPGAQPRPELVDAILSHHGKATPQREIAPTLMGVVMGALIGVLLKGMALPGVPWGPETGLIGLLVGSVALLGFGASVAAAGLAIVIGRRHPHLLQWASVNLLTVLIVVLV
ncbi:hypothetical protein [Phaeobacter sp. B1627]|uniref:hypothetical protein n=1 Tax=Phaeobacter sp. B1627 TaxID=2583809 RepID=UPI00111A5D16|nr:hypothetical protein [Phaeobacter sp. B1627]TNJ41652.1 hypothetical protein FGE21_13805 [Phaeobacter sp. B1627]